MGFFIEFVESAYKLTEPSNDNLDRLKTMWFQMVGNFLVCTKPCTFGTRIYMKMFGILANRLKDQAVTKISESTGKLTEPSNDNLD